LENSSEIHIFFNQLSCWFNNGEAEYWDSRMMATIRKDVPRELHRRLLRETLGSTQRLNIVRQISALLPDHRATVLDVGCGNGLFAHDLMRIKPRLSILGAETKPQAMCRIQQCGYDGKTLPFRDKQFDYVLLINVLHHADDPAMVLSEAARVALHGVVIKDHYANSRLDFYTLVAMEKIGNAFVDISQPYNFLSENQWSTLFERVGLRIQDLRKRFVCYNTIVDLVFGRNLHFVARVAPQIGTRQLAS